MSGNPPIADDLALFLQSGLAIVVATRDGDLESDGAWAWAALVEDDRRHMTIYLYEEAAAAMLRNLETYPEIAVLLDEPTSHRACQVKGTFVASRRAGDDERSEVERQVDGLRSQLQSIGISPAMTAGWKFWPGVALRMRVAQVFDQTPGPGTGEPLA